MSGVAKVNFINFKSIYPEFLYPGGSTKEESEIFKLKDIKNLKVFDILTWYNPFSWIRAGFLIKAKIFHFHWWTYYLFPIFFTILVIAKIRGKKIVCTAHNTLSHESNFLDFVFSKIIFKISNKIIVHSKNNKKDLIKNLKIENKKIIIIPYGTLNFYSDIKISKKRARNKLNIKKDSRVILFFGSIREYKGLDTLIKAFSLVRKNIKNSKLIIAGKNWEKWGKYQLLIDNLDITKDVLLFLDYIPTDKVKYFFTAADVVVLPYRHFESQSGPGNIALSFGKPLIVTNTGGLPNLVLDKNCVVPSDNSEEMASKIIKVLKSKNFIKKLEKDSKINAINFSWDNIAILTIKQYKKLLA